MASPTRRLGLHLLANQFPPLHGLRALAVVSVLQIHVTVSLDAIGLLSDETFFLRSTSVWFGMDLFFILSGFLIGTRAAVFAMRPTPWTPAEMFDELYLRTHTRFDILVAGVLLAYVQRTYGATLREALRPRRIQLALALVPALCCGALLGPLAHRHDVSRLFAWGTVTSVMYFSLILLVLNTESVITRWLSSRSFLWFATLGYGVYLVHPPVISTVVAPIAAMMVVVFHLPALVVWATSLALLLVVATGVAYILHILVEKPALWLRDKVAR